jgi:hypothetical protein
MIWSVKVIWWWSDDRSGDVAYDLEEGEAPGHRRKARRWTVVTCLSLHPTVWNAVSASGTYDIPHDLNILITANWRVSFGMECQLEMLQIKKSLILEHIPVISYVRHGVCLSCSRTALAKRNATGWLPSSILKTAAVGLKATDRQCFGAKLCRSASAPGKVAQSV